MKKILCFLFIMLILTPVSAMAGVYSADENNADNFCALLIDLVYAYETPRDGDTQTIDKDLEAIRSVNESDFEIASAIARHWRAVYLDKSYHLYLYNGSDRAEELEHTTLHDSNTHAFVVLGYELENGEMTDELKGRCEAAAAAARSFPSAIIVCSGGATGKNNPEMHTEAGMMKTYLTENCGIDPDRIHIDERAKSTVDNAVNTFEIMYTQNIETMTIITSGYHQRWGQAIYNAMGAICLQKTGYNPRIVENYSFDTEPAHEMYRRDDRIAVRQLASILNLPKETSDKIKNAF